MESNENSAVFEMDYDVLGSITLQDVIVCPFCGEAVLVNDEELADWEDVLTYEDGEVVTQRWCGTCAEEHTERCHICGRATDCRYTKDDEKFAVFVKDSGYLVCKDCVEENAVECEHCHDWHRNTHIVNTNHHTEECWCRECVYDDAFYCEHCNEYYDASEYCSVEVDGEIWCEDCRDEDASYCERCGCYTAGSVTRVHTSFRDSEYWCRECVSNYALQCSECGDYFSEDSELFNYEQDACYECCPDNPEDEYINCYSYKPCPIFNHIGDERLLFMGMELETGEATEEGRLEAAKSISENHDTFVYLKEDVSIPDYGFELVTHPFTLEFFKEYGFNDILKTCDENGLKGHDVEGGDVGIHIHIDKRSLPGEEGKKKIWALMNSCQEKVEIFARRSGNTYCVYGHSFSDSHRLRYSVVNLCNEKTIEIRAFRSTLKYDTVLATIEFVHACTNFIQKGYMDHLEINEEINDRNWDPKVLWEDLCNYINSTEIESGIYTALVAYMKHKNIFNVSEVIVNTDAIEDVKRSIGVVNQ